MLAKQQMRARCLISPALLTGLEGLLVPSGRGYCGGAALPGQSRQADAPAGGPQQQTQLRNWQLQQRLLRPRRSVGGLAGARQQQTVVQLAVRSMQRQTCRAAAEHRSSGSLAGEGGRRM